MSTTPSLMAVVCDFLSSQKSRATIRTVVSAFLISSLGLGASAAPLALRSPKDQSSTGKGGSAPRKILVVTTTLGFRHSSIPTAEKVLAEMAADTKAFTIEYARVEPSDPQFKGPDGKPDMEKVKTAITQVLAEKMNRKALEQYDGVVFANTTGDLPLPDKEGFLQWIKSGKSFVGMHAATDTFPNFPGYIDMIGGQFLRHGPQVEVDIQNKNQECPMCKHLSGTWTLFDEIYQFKNFDPNKVYTVLSLDKHPNDKTPGFYPISWCRNYGKGKVFYTALGHREDIWDPNTPAGFERKNSKEISRAYQAHILSGIKWTLGMSGWSLPEKRMRLE